MSVEFINDDSCGLSCLIDSQFLHIIQYGKDKCTLLSGLEFFFFPLLGSILFPTSQAFLGFSRIFLRYEPFNLHLQIPIIRPIPDFDSDSMLDHLDQMPHWARLLTTIE